MSNKFGPSALNSNLNNNSNTLNNNLGFTKNDLVNLIITGRVIDIILDKNHPEFSNLGEWTSIGTIEFIDTNTQAISSSPGTTKIYAKPLFSNQKNYPILNEIVYIISLPNQGVMNNGDSKQYYYFSPINIWNHPHHNAAPFFVDKNSSTETQNKKFEIISLGNPNKSSAKEKNINLGKGFKEYSNIHPLNYFLGDYLLEGRWGNSIRLGSTYNSDLNNWSSKGENGNPILIIRNGQPNNSSNEGWIPITEDINNDLSSIYVTSNQIIPIKASSKSYKSYSTPPISPDKFDSSQIIFNSNRLLFNSNKDHILFSSIKSVGINSVESINLDTKLFICDSPVIKLGNKDTTNPMLKGNETVKTFNTICDSLIKLATALSTLAEIFPSAPQAGVNIAASEVQVQINTLKGTLNQLKSKTNFLI